MNTRGSHIDHRRLRQKSKYCRFDVSASVDAILEH